MKDLNIQKELVRKKLLEEKKLDEFFLNSMKIKKENSDEKLSN